MKYKIGEWIIYNNKKWKNYWKKTYGISLYGKIGKIIDISKNSYFSYLIEYKEFIHGTSGDGRGKEGHCRWFNEKEISSLDQLKLKKLVQS